MKTVTNEYIKVNKFTRPGNKLVGVRGIVIHWTANPGASARNHWNYFNNGAGGRYASAHIFVDTKESLCIVPLNEVTYACNESGYSKVKKFNGNFGYSGGNANGCTVSVEMCVEKNGTISPITIEKTVKIVAELCKVYGLNQNDVYRHYDITGKSCPTPFVSSPQKFVDFKKDVAKVLKGVTPSKPKPTKPTKAEYYDVKDKVVYVQCLTNVGIYSDLAFKNKKSFKDVGQKIEVIGVEKTKAGTPRLKVKGGYITANKAYVKKVAKPTVDNSKNYYTTAPKRIITQVNNVKLYNSTEFSEATNTGGKYNKGNIFTIVGVKLSSKGTPRLITKSGYYMTANKKYVRPF